MTVTPGELSKVIGVSASAIRQYLRDRYWDHYSHMPWQLNARMVLEVCKRFGVKA